MNTPKNIDSIDEALRIIYLESAKEDLDSEKEMEFILSETVEAMDKTMYNQMIDRLTFLISEPSLGALLWQSMEAHTIDDEALSSHSNLPLTVINDLKSDKIYSNNIPITFLKRLLEKLNIPFKTAESAIRKTFEILQNQASFSSSGNWGFSPAFRKGIHTSREALVKSNARNSGRELYENKEALDKYLDRLSELMK